MTQIALVALLVSIAPEVEMLHRMATVQLDTIAQAAWTHPHRLDMNAHKDISAKKVRFHLRDAHPEITRTISVSPIAKDALLDISVIILSVQLFFITILPVRKDITVRKIQQWQTNTLAQPELSVT